MIEAKRGQIVIIKCPKFPELEGIIESVESDRLKIFYPKDFESYAWALSEGDEVFVKVHTQFGIKPMNSMVICAPSSDGKLVIENAKTLAIYQKREFVRAAVDFRFFIKKEGKLIGASCADISAGGIKFIPDEYIFNIDDTIELKFLSEEFGKDINANARIINSIGDKLIAKYSDISEFDRDKIAGFCLKVLSERG